MIKYDNGKLIINFTQSNAYGIRQLKIKDQPPTKIKSNMKKITIDRESAEELKKFYNKSKMNLPILFRGFKINKSTIIKLYDEIESQINDEIFNGDGEVFLIDEEIINGPDQIEGNLLLKLRDPNRDEIIISFLAISAGGEFIDRKSKNEYLQFNNAVFSCVFHDFVKGIIDLKEKEIFFKVNFQKIIEAGLGLVEPKKYNRKTKEDISNG
ncbi:hypothetical protein [Spiroplasma alleghenense]|uniref:Uncharacterized protein n=1 Tax=Spiroplasma alleghenense TaxID=216931 RepID=A0A345Z596_9MOLU|nr:hypothetical protein [Spiroplasma alleghenense]AXK51775.1 hypothetical protein SALLE_v1c11050 [Spiroplasma alleghenense]